MTLFVHHQYCWSLASQSDMLSGILGKPATEYKVNLSQLLQTSNNTSQTILNIFNNFAP